ncbi:MAG: murein biosynthesis integral membrane protein MurJ [Gammaproteobacteria bacterium]|nr:murein biosynthesis integral membrane protein MurJ [Gammaproteobacteria bacterium]
MSKVLAHSTATVGSMTLFSRIAGFIRDLVIARVFGAGPAADAFFVAFKIPNFFRRIFAEGAFSQAFVPVLNEYHTQQDLTEEQNFINRTAGNLGAVLLIITIIAIVCSPLLIRLFAPGFEASGEKYILAVEMLRITFPYLLLISLASLAAGILNSYGSFAVPAFAPVFLNLALVGSAIGLAPFLDHPITALAWGVLIGGLAQLVFQWPFLKRIQRLPKFKIDWQHPGVKRVFQLMGPSLLGASAVQINLLVDTLIASFLKDGSIAWLYYSDRLMEFPLGVFGIALATVILPHLSRQVAAHSPQAFTHTMNWSLHTSLLIGLPAAIGLIVLAQPTLATLFYYGAFAEKDVLMASKSLVAYATGLPAFILVKVLSAGCFAHQDTKTPVRITLIAILCNIVLNLILVFPLAHAGLALATSLSAWIQVILLFLALRRKNRITANPFTQTISVKIMLASLSMAILLLAIVPAYSNWIEWTGVRRASYLGSIILLSLIGYGVTLWICGIRPSDFLGKENNR